MKKSCRVIAVGSLSLVTAMFVGCEQPSALQNHDTTTVQNGEQPKQPQLPFVLSQNDFGSEARWTMDYLENVHAVLVEMMDNPDVDPPHGVKVVLQKIDNEAALGGFATPDQIAFQASSWPREKFRLWILAHELTNLFANHYAGAGGFPSDWWSNGRSPFPIYASALICEALGEQEPAEWLRTVDTELEDQKLYWALHDKYGFPLFARFFKLVRNDGIDLGQVGSHDWPSADECRSAYTIAYLSRAARKNLAPVFRQHKIGSKPKDWDQRHPDRPFVEYSISDKEVAALIEKQHLLFQTPDKTDEFNRQLADYRKGKGWVPDEDP